MDKKQSNFLAGLVLLSGIFFLNQTNAAVRLPALIGNNMVLQQNAAINVWGWADDGEKVIVQASWLTTSAEVITTKEGTWKTIINTPKAGGPYTMTITGRDYSIKIEKILIGEVWLCSGQSNMDLTIKGLGGWGNYKPEVRDEVQRGDFASVRLFTVQKDTSAYVRTDCKGNWLTVDTGTVDNFSATAWFYGSSLSKKLGIPVGLIYTAWGGTAAEVWTPVASLEAAPELQYFIHHYSGYAWWPGTAGVLYNAMIHPLINYTIKGAIWYQGESNRMDYKLYPALMNTMITSWRKAWGIGDFPFYYVQIAPYLYKERNSGALLREAQMKCLSIPNTGMAVTMDIAGDINDIHPKNKLDVGKRLSLWALTKTYGQDVGSFSGPVYKDYKIEKKSISIEFSFTDKGLKITETAKNNFVIAGDDKVFYPATVKIQGNKLVVSSKKVKHPVAVRYAFLNTSVSSLFNGTGLPASSFRTDDWEIDTK